MEQENKLNIHKKYAEGKLQPRDVDKSHEFQRDRA